MTTFPAFYTLYKHGRYLDVDENLRTLCNKHGIPYKDCLLGIVESGEHNHNDLLITACPPSWEDTSTATPPQPS